jgi:hypothetical protein
MAWLEERSGFDLTPCFDEAGKWETSSECAAFDADPRFDGDWIDYCDGERVDPVQSCEPAQIGSSSSSSGAIEGASTTEDPGTDASSSQAAEETIPDGCACATSGDPRDRWSLWLWSLTSACCRPRRRRAASGYAPRTCIGTP